MGLEPVLCPNCKSSQIVKHGKTAEGKQRYKCCNQECSRHSFILDYSHRGYLPIIKQQISDMAMNDSGIRDPARVLKISPTTVIEELKKGRHLEQVNQALLEHLKPTAVTMVKPIEEAEAEEMWRFVQSKKQQRW